MEKGYENLCLQTNKRTKTVKSAVGYGLHLYERKENGLGRQIRYLSWIQTACLCNGLCLCSLVSFLNVPPWLFCVDLTKCIVFADLMIVILSAVVCLDSQTVVYS